MKNKKEMKKEKLKDNLVIVAFILLVVAFWLFFAWMIHCTGEKYQSPPKQKTDYTRLFLKPEVRIVEEDNFIAPDNFLYAVSPVFYQRPQIYASLIGKLEQCESGGNKWAIGKAQEKGCLQFKDRTWLYFCVGKYKVADSLEEIWDCEKQKQCADYMVQDGLQKHWSCHSKI